jgi:hypothetical protein
MSKSARKLEKCLLPFLFVEDLFVANFFLVANSLFHVQMIAKMESFVPAKQKHYYSNSFSFLFLFFFLFFFSRQRCHCWFSPMPCLIKPLGGFLDEDISLFLISETASIGGFQSKTYPRCLNEVFI